MPSAAPPPLREDMVLAAADSIPTQAAERLSTGSTFIGKFPAPDPATPPLRSTPARAELVGILRGDMLDLALSPATNRWATPAPVHRAFFCRFDDALDARRIPLRMRLGDLQTVNQMERKPGC